jgi:hypothetical protein
MRYVNHLKYNLLAIFMIAGVVNPASAMQETQGKYDGEYVICRYGENLSNSSGRLVLKQPNEHGVDIQSFRLEGGHYKDRIQKEAFSQPKEPSKLGGGRTFQRLFNELSEEKESVQCSFAKWYQTGERKIAEYILLKLPTLYSKLHFLGNLENTEQFGVEDTYQDDDIHVRFHVDNRGEEPEYNLYIEYAYHKVERSSEQSGERLLGISVGYPAERLVLIKVGSPRYERMQAMNRLFKM